MGGGPGKTLEHGGWEQIAINYPLSIFTSKKRKYKNIEYRGKYKIYSFIDNILFKIKNIYQK